MSLVPLMFRDWWDELDTPPRGSRLIDQHFGLGLNRDDLLNTISNYRSPATSLLRSGYYRPWGPVARQDSGSSSVTSDSNKVQVILDVQQFTPNEITVKSVDNSIVVEGKHEEKQDEHGYVSRHFIRRYVLPRDVEVGNITSSLSSDGVLTITAPKKSAGGEKGERAITIVQTGQPALKNTSEKEKEIKIEQQN